MLGIISGEAPWRRTRRRFVQPAPGVGVDWTISVPAGMVWDFESIQATLVSSAVAATRAVRLQVTDGNTVYLDLPASATQILSLTRRYSWFPLAPPSAIGSGILSPMPDLRVDAGTIIRVVTDLLDVGDQWSSIVLDLIQTEIREGGQYLADVPDLIVAVTGIPTS